MEWQVQVEMIFRVAIAVLLGGVVGMERELQRKAAGLRTHMLVTGAAALLACLGEMLIRIYALPAAPDAAIRADPTRIIQSIILGIGFIGAGTIMHTQQRERVKNLTTAGSILFASGIGIACALKQYTLAVGVTGLLLLINSVVGVMEKRYTRRAKKNNKSSSQPNQKPEKPAF